MSSVSTTWEPEPIDKTDEDEEVISNPVEPVSGNNVIKEEEKKLSLITWIFYVICMVVGLFIVAWICITIYDWWNGTSHGSGMGGSLGDYVMMGVLMS